MFKTAALTITLVLGIGAGAQAAFIPAQLPAADSAIIQVGEGCGPGFWRGPQGGCNPFRTPYGPARGTRFECPPGWHIGPGGGRCFPDR